MTFTLGWLPSSGLENLREPQEGLAAVADLTTHLIMPVAVLALVSVAGLMRYVRSSMLEVLQQDYIRTARGNGLPERTVLIGHALRNAAIPGRNHGGADDPGAVPGLRHHRVDLRSAWNGTPVRRVGQSARGLTAAGRFGDSCPERTDPVRSGAGLMAMPLRPPT
ncbi:hypothetical protein Ssi02_75190 [Sinosporangium siamense]|uniref:ABC transmembrane type-1 domain-containing protein n=1 Tax=Sinosporangium siamense TaxID=1367973 RepID=A0A919RP56_9ACTN|nr:hypothetical protein Ssi02_75190 [Sinosporangium siamense]